MSHLVRSIEVKIDNYHNVALTKLKEIWMCVLLKFFALLFDTDWYLLVQWSTGHQVPPEKTERYWTTLNDKPTTWLQYLVSFLILIFIDYLRFFSSLALFLSSPLYLHHIINTSSSLVRHHHLPFIWIAASYSYDMHHCLFQMESILLLPSSLFLLLQSG